MLHIYMHLVIKIFNFLVRQPQPRQDSPQFGWATSGIQSRLIMAQSGNSCDPVKTR